MRFAIHGAQNLRRAHRSVELPFGIFESQKGRGDFAVPRKTLFGDGRGGAFEDAAGLNACLQGGRGGGKYGGGA